MTGGATRYVRQVGLGDHLCLPFASDDEQREVVSVYIADGLRRGERVLYLADKTAPSAIDGWLSHRGVDGALAVARGQLEVRTAADDQFDPASLVGAIRTEARRARAAGFQGLRVSGEMSWTLRRLPDALRLAEYETGVAASVSGALAAVCQYDERLFDAASVSDLAAHHAGTLRADPLHDDCRLRIVPTFGPRGLEVTGVVDDGTAPTLADALTHAATWPETVLHLDLSGLTFIDVSGIRMIVRAAETLAPARRLHVHHLAPTLRKVIRIVGWDTTPGLFLDEEVEPT